MHLGHSTDALFKAVFSAPEEAVGLIRSLLPPDLAAAIDWSTLALAPGTFVDEALAQRHTDLLFVVHLRGAPVFLYVLLEHKARAERFVALSLAGYLVRIWHGWRVEHPNEASLPQIIPIVVHHGRRPWREPTQLRELIAAGSPAAADAAGQFGADLRFVLCDLTGVDDHDLRRRPLQPLGRVALAFLARLRGALPGDVIAIVRRWLDQVARVLAAPDGAQRLLVLWSYLLMVTDVPVDELAAVVAELGAEARELMTTTGHRLRAEGRQEGRTEGRGDLLLVQLRTRFGEVAEATERRVRAATDQELERWAIAILRAATLDEVLQGP